MLRRIIYAIAALAAMAAVLAGMPYALLRVGTNPITAATWASHHLWQQDDSNTVLLGAVTLAGWLAWATCVQGFLAALLDIIRPGSRSLPAFGLQRALFTMLLGAVLAGSAGSTLTAVLPPVAGHTISTTDQGLTPRPTTATAPAVHHGPGADRDDVIIHTVLRGEHLLDLAERYYGDSGDYHRIIAANSGVTQPDGDALTPGQTLIRPGWQLRIPQPRTAVPVDIAAADVRADSSMTITLVAAGRSYDVPVHPGDSLFTIAENWLGDGNRWREIYDLNKGRHFTDGRTLHEPQLIHPGWTLHLPVDAQPPAHAQPHPEHPQPPTPQQPPAQSPTPPTSGIAPTGGVTPPSAPASSTPTAAPSRSSTTSSASPAAPHQRQTPSGIELPGGGWVDAGLVTALLSVGGLVWAHRRRRYRGGQGFGTARRDPDLRHLPATMRHIRREQPAIARPTVLAVADTAPSENVEAVVDTVEATDVIADEVAVDIEQPRSPERESDGRPEPVVPAAAGEHADLWPTSGLGITGPGAHAAVRGMLIAALSTGDATLHSRTCVVVPAATLASLLGATAVAVPEMMRLQVTGGLEDALAEIDAQALYRARLCQEHDVDSVPQLRELHPDVDDVPPLLLITDVGTSAEQTRIAWALSHHHRLDIHGVLLGDWSHGDVITVDTDGTTSRPREDGKEQRHRYGHPADVGRLAVLDEEQTLQLLLTLAEAHNGQPPPEPQLEAPQHLPAPETPADLPPEPAAVPSGSDAATPDEDYPHDEEGEDESDDRTGPADTDEPDPEDATAAAPEGSSDDADAEPVTVSPVSLPQVRVAVLGSPRLPDYHSAPGKPGLRERAMELLAYLVVNNGRASLDAVLEDLVPDSTFTSGKQLIASALYSLRQAMKDLGGDITGNGRAYVNREGRTFFLHKDKFDVDLWRMREHYIRAKASHDPQQRVRQLRAALAAYTGRFADGETWEWIEVYREAVRRDHVDIVAALADQLAADPRQALAVLTPAIAAYPTTELLYQHAMRAHAALGDATSIKTLRRDLTRALEEIPAEPDADTRALAVNLLADIARRAGRPARGDRR